MFYLVAGQYKLTAPHSPAPSPTRACTCAAAPPPCAGARALRRKSLGDVPDLGGWRSG